MELAGSNSISWTGTQSDAFARGKVVFGRDETGVGEIQICTLTSNIKPTRAILEGPWKERGAGNAMPVVLAADYQGEIWLLGPSIEDPLVGPIDSQRAQNQLNALLNEPDGISARKLAQTLIKSHSTGGGVGFTNHFLFASYHLRNNVPKRTDWDDASKDGLALIDARGRSLIEKLGFEFSPISGDSPNVLVLRSSSGNRRAIAVLLDETEHFDRRSLKYQISPVARGLELAGREDVPWVVVLRESTLRLYPGRDGVGVGQRGQSETFFELDLNLIDASFAGLLTLIFSANALETGGSAEQILEDSGKYAADLGTRLRDRVYEHVVPQISVAIAERLPNLGYQVDDEGLKVAFALSLRVLFRLLFQAYGEDTGLLPAGRNEGYDSNSLQAFVKRDLNADVSEYSAEAKSIWLDLTQVWDAIYNGNKRWSVPPYGGSLFEESTEEGLALKKLALPDSVMGPALLNLLSEITEEGVRGPVDFRSLQVREFGTIYEGLLESSLSLAESDLCVDKDGIFYPASENEEVSVPKGSPYFHSSSGARKVTGSYYTSKILVDHLVDKSVTPALEEHLTKVSALLESGREREASTLFWDFRVADLAMGSAHFLVAAVDKIERMMRDYLTLSSVPGVRAELERLADKAREALGRDADVASEITEAQLLRRQIARRCVYGIDINPLAVELARLAIWIHTFVPGLPMSSLNHNLVLGNSLTGIGTIEEAIQDLNVTPLFEPIIRQPLSLARDLLLDYANASEADKAEVAEGKKILEKASEAALPVKAIFDVALGVKVGSFPRDTVFTDEQFLEAAKSEEIRGTVASLGDAHMPLLFPEVFLRNNPGFDVVIGNPPWEVVKVEEQKWWGLRIPGVRSLPKKAMNEAIASFRSARPDLEREYQAEIRSTDVLREAITKSFPGLGAGGDPDLYQAFAWRNWKLLRRGGRLSMVIPRMAMSSSSLIPWRLEVLDNGSFEDVCNLTNTGKWVFAEIHAQYSVALVTAAKSETHSVTFGGPFNSEREFLFGRQKMSTVSAARYKSWSTNMALPVLGDSESVPLFDKFYLAPRFGDERSDIAFRPIAELHATADSHLYDFSLDDSTNTVPVLKGASFNLWNPNPTEIYALADERKLRDHLWSKMQRAMKSKASAYYQLKFTQDDLPIDYARIAFRLITNRTNSRTTVVCLLPPGSTAQHSAQFMVNKSGDVRSEAFLLGVMASIPFDWVARKWVELNFTFEVLENLPIPVFKPSSITNRVVEISGQLAAQDDRFKAWADAVGVSVSTISQDIQEELIAENDALICLLYGLNESDVQRVFETFHVGWSFEQRLQKVLKHFKEWKVKL